MSYKLSQRVKDMDYLAQKIASIYAEDRQADDLYAGRDWGEFGSKGKFNNDPGYKHQYGSKAEEIGIKNWTERERKRYRMYWAAKYSNPPRYIKYKNMENEWVDVYCQRAGRSNGICESASGSKKKKTANSVLPSDKLSLDVIELLNREISRTCTHLHCDKGGVLRAVNEVLNGFGLKLVSNVSPNRYSIGASTRGDYITIQNAHVCLGGQGKAWVA